MRKIKLVIHKLPRSQNTIKKWLFARQNWRYTEVRDDWYAAIMVALIEEYNCLRLKPLIKKASITIRYYFKDQYRRDLDNYAGFKPVLDGLKGRVIKDDWHKIAKVKWHILYDKEKPHTSIEIQEMA